MREDPIISGGVIKALLVLLVAGGLGFGAYAAVGDGIDIDLPELPDLDTLGTEGATTLDETTLENTTIDPGPAADTFTSAFFADALVRVREETGAGQQASRLFINEIQAQFIVIRGDDVESYSVRADSDDLSREEATVTISGNAELEDFGFALDAVDPEAVDRMLAAAARKSGVDDFEPTVLSLERALPFGRRALQWTINARGGGRNLLFRANASGGDVRNEGGSGTPAAPTGAEDAQKLSECVQRADNDPQRILDCLEQSR